MAFEAALIYDDQSFDGTTRYAVLTEPVFNQTAVLYEETFLDAETRLLYSTTATFNQTGVLYEDRTFEDAQRYVVVTEPAQFIEATLMDHYFLKLDPGDDVDLIVSARLDKPIAVPVFSPALLFDQGYTEIDEQIEFTRSLKIAALRRFGPGLFRTKFYASFSID